VRPTRFTGSDRRTGSPRRRVAGRIGIVVLAALILAALAAPVVAPYGPLDQDTSPLLSPSWSHYFGTDELGRDVLSRVIYGLRLTLLTALCSATSAAIIGTALGLLAGYFGGLIDALLMRVTDVILAFPATLLAVVLVAVMGGGVLPLIVAISFVGIPPFARLTRASAMSVREREYVDAQRAAGAPSFDIMIRTVLPNSVGSAGVQFVVTAAIAVLTESGLSFLGLGAPAPAPALGSMLFQGNLNLFYAPWYSVMVGLSIVIVVASLDALGSYLQIKLGASQPRGAVVA